MSYEPYEPTEEEIELLELGRKWILARWGRHPKMDVMDQMRIMMGEGLQRIMELELFQKHDPSCETRKPFTYPVKLCSCGVTDNG